MREFNKIIGYTSIKKELEQIADTLKNGDVYQKLGVSAPKGLLLHGVPGVGKSLMASRILGALGGMAAVEQKFGIVESGSSRDLAHAFDKVRELVVDDCVCGFSLYSRGFHDSAELVSHQEQAIATEVEKYYRKAKEIISLNADFFEKVAVELAKKKLLHTADIQRIKAECTISI